MNKGLEYVENQIAKLKDDLQHYTMVEKDSALASQIRYDLEQFETIENELKRLYELEKTTLTFSNVQQLMLELEKSKKALEIVKEKGIILQFIKEAYTVEQYNAGVYGTLVKPLTQEEYDLLKEVL